MLPQTFNSAASTMSVKGFCKATHGKKHVSLANSFTLNLCSAWLMIQGHALFLPVFCWYSMSNTCCNPLLMPSVNIFLFQTVVLFSRTNVHHKSKGFSASCFSSPWRVMHHVMLLLWWPDVIIWQTHLVNVFVKTHCVSNMISAKRGLV